MYIEDRLFSENTEEVLYSVLMDEDEYALYSEFQKEFAVSKISSAFRHLKRNASRAGTQIKAGFNMGLGKDLTAAQAHEVALNQRFATRYGKTMRNPKLKAIDPAEAERSARAWTKIDQAGKGATSGGILGYFPKK